MQPDGDVKWPLKFAGRIVERKFPELQGSEVTYERLRHDWKEPILVLSQENFGPHLPRNLTDERLFELVGRVPVPVIDVASQTQRDKAMDMKEWMVYYTQPHKRDRVLNVISLEISHTELGKQVTPPDVVMESLDLVEKYWPDGMRGRPFVERYLLMSMAKSFTDFHIDFGGSAVWYHPMRGAKVFLMIEPTRQNLETYRQWSGRLPDGGKRDALWANTVAHVLYIPAGVTALIPSGWIHAVFTPMDSLVFGGNFLTPLSIPMSLAVRRIEFVTHTAKKFQFPYFAQLMWFTAHALQSADPAAMSLSERESLVALAATIDRWSTVSPEHPRHVPKPLRAQAQQIRDRLNALADRCRSLLPAERKDQTALAAAAATSGLFDWEDENVSDGETEEGAPESKTPEDSPALAEKRAQAEASAIHLSDRRALALAIKESKRVYKLEVRKRKAEEAEKRKRPETGSPVV